MTRSPHRHDSPSLSEEALFPVASPPLAELLRPKTLDDVLGQDHVLATGGFLHDSVRQDYLPSLIFWGPSGCGKTTLASLLAQRVKRPFVALSAVMTGVTELKKIFARAEQERASGQSLVLFIDEIHRFHKGQQDAFLPHLEKGTFTLLGATTENPSFELNNALLSRCQVVTLRTLDDSSLHELLRRAEAHEGSPLPLTDEARDALVSMASGDGRYLLNMAESVWRGSPTELLDEESLSSWLNRRASLGDRRGDSHYNVASALHKSLRASDADGALYWLARAIEAGESHDFIARRLVRFASEDVGLADPQALPQALAAWEAWHRLGVPEGELALAQAVLYLSTAAKSNACYRAWQGAQKSAAQTNHLPPPSHILNAPTQLMKKEGYGEGYVYDHDTEHAFAGHNCFPHDMKRQGFYHPTTRGYERDVAKRLAWWEKRRHSS